MVLNVLCVLSVVTAGDALQTMTDKEVKSFLRCNAKLSFSVPWHGSTRSNIKWRRGVRGEENKKEAALKLSTMNERTELKRLTLHSAPALQRRRSHKQKTTTVLNFNLRCSFYLEKPQEHLQISRSRWCPGSRQTFKSWCGITV